MNITGAVQQNAIGVFAVTTCSACLLIVVFKIFRHIIMHHKAHIGLINSHSESIGCNNQIASVINEIVLIFASYFIAQSCVINQRIIAVFIEKIADFFYIFRVAQYTIPL